MAPGKYQDSGCSLVAYVADFGLCTILGRPTEVWELLFCSFMYVDDKCRLVLMGLLVVTNEM